MSVQRQCRCRELSDEPNGCQKTKMHLSFHKIVIKTSTVKTAQNEVCNSPWNPIAVVILFEAVVCPLLSATYIKQILVYMTRSGSWRFRVFRRGISFIGVTRTLLVGSVPRFVPQPPIITALDPVPY